MYIYIDIYIYTYKYPHIYIYLHTNTNINAYTCMYKYIVVWIVRFSPFWISQTAEPGKTRYCPNDLCKDDTKWVSKGCWVPTITDEMGVSRIPKNGWFISWKISKCTITGFLMKMDENGWFMIIWKIWKWNGWQLGVPHFRKPPKSVWTCVLEGNRPDHSTQC